MAIVQCSLFNEAEYSFHDHHYHCIRFAVSLSRNLHKN